MKSPQNELGFNLPHGGFPKIRATSKRGYRGLIGVVYGLGLRVSKIRDTFLEVIIMRVIVFWGLYWGPLVSGSMRRLGLGLYKGFIGGIQEYVVVILG